MHWSALAVRYQQHILVVHPHASAPLTSAASLRGAVCAQVACSTSWSAWGKGAAKCWECSHRPLYWMTQVRQHVAAARGARLGVDQCPCVSVRAPGREVPAAVLRKQKQLKLVRWAIGMAVVGFVRWLCTRRVPCLSVFVMCAGTHPRCQCDALHAQRAPVHVGRQALPVSSRPGGTCPGWRTGVVSPGCRVIKPAHVCVSHGGRPTRGPHGCQPWVAARGSCRWAGGRLWGGVGAGACRRMGLSRKRELRYPGGRRRCC